MINKFYHVKTRHCVNAAYTYASVYTPSSRMSNLSSSYTHAIDYNPMPKELKRLSKSLMGGYHAKKFF